MEDSLLPYYRDNIHPRDLLQEEQDVSQKAVGPAGKQMPSPHFHASLQLRCYFSKSWKSGPDKAELLSIHSYKSSRYIAVCLSKSKTWFDGKKQL